MNNPTIWDNIFHFFQATKQANRRKGTATLKSPSFILGFKKSWPLTQRSRVFFGRCSQETYGITEPWFEPLETVVNVTRMVNPNGEQNGVERCNQTMLTLTKRGLEAGERANKDAWSCLRFLVFWGRCDMWSPVFWRGFRVWNVMNHDYHKSTSISLKRMACSDQIHTSSSSSSLVSDIDLWIDDFGALQSALGMDGWSHVFCFQGRCNMCFHLHIEYYHIKSIPSLEDVKLQCVLSFYFLILVVCFVLRFCLVQIISYSSTSHATNWISFSPWWPLWMSSLCFPSWSSNWCVLAYGHLAIPGLLVTFGGF